MNSCEHIRNLLTNALDAGDSTPPVPVREHLAGCAPCRVWWEQAREVETLLHGSGIASPSAPASLRRRIQSALEAEPTPSRWPHALSRSPWLAVAAALVVVVGLSVLMVTSRSAQSDRSIPGATGPAQTVTIPSLSAVPSLGNLISVPPPIEQARGEFTWLTQALVSNTQSAVRAFVPATDNPPNIHPTKTAPTRGKSVSIPGPSRATRA